MIKLKLLAEGHSDRQMIPLHFGRNWIRDKRTVGVKNVVYSHDCSTHFQSQYLPLLHLGFVPVFCVECCGIKCKIMINSQQRGKSVVPVVYCCIHLSYMTCVVQSN